MYVYIYIYIYIYDKFVSKGFLKLLSFSMLSLYYDLV